MSDHLLTVEDLPKSLGAFKPVGHVMVAFADLDLAEQAMDALLDAGFSQEEVLHFGAAEGCDQMQAMIEKSSDFSGFGYEITLMRRYKKLAEEGHRWLLVHAPGDEQTEKVAEVARQFDAPMAVKYHRLAVEDLI